MRRTLITVFCAALLAILALGGVAHSAPDAPCSGAAARDLEQHCTNPALRLRVLPLPEDALLEVSRPCVTVEVADVWWVCASGATPERATATVALIGDSHAEDTYNALRVVFPDAHIILASSPGCAAFAPAVHRLPVDPANVEAMACGRLVTSIYGDRARLQQADLIVLSSFKSADQRRQIEHTFDYYSKLGRPILVFGNPPAYTAPLRDIVRVRHLTPDQPVPAEFIDITHGESVDAQTRALAAQYGLHFVPMRDFFCPHGRCTAWTPDQTRLVSYDDHHLSRDAAEAFGRAREGPIRAAAVTR